MSAPFAPNIEIYTLIACSVHKPDLFEQVAPSVISRRTVGGEMVDYQRLPENKIVEVLFEKSNWLTRHEASEEARKKCAADPLVQAEVAKLHVGR